MLGIIFAFFVEFFTLHTQYSVMTFTFVLESQDLTVDHNQLRIRNCLMQAKLRALRTIIMIYDWGRTGGIFGFYARTDFYELFSCRPHTKMIKDS